MRMVEYYPNIMQFVSANKKQPETYSKSEINIQ